jgi:hypothetical protein
MEPYDPTMEAIVTAMLKALAPGMEQTTLGYVPQLYAVQASLADLLHIALMPLQGPAKPPHPSPPPPDDPTMLAVLHEALRRLDPKAEDQFLAPVEVGQRTLACIDRELSKWTSALTQPLGPSGQASVALTEEA